MAHDIVFGHKVSMHINRNESAVYFDHRDASVVTNIAY